MKTNAILIAAMALMSNAAIAQTNAKPVHRFVVTDYGAVADGKTVNTKAIQTAIDKCASNPRERSKRMFRIVKVSRPLVPSVPNFTRPVGPSRSDATNLCVE